MAQLGQQTRIIRMNPQPPGGEDPRLNPSAGVTGGADQPQRDSSVVSTVFDARALKVFKGTIDAGSTIEVRQLGGALDGITYSEKGTSSLKAGKVQVLFLNTYPDLPATLLNPDQGQYDIDEAGNLVPLPTNTIAVSMGDLNKLAKTGDQH
ncbi:hypothetical protein [Nonomuraea sp. NPDC050786]|uniref:hypothetical protein n=1 Tax=Nonomuraea sp. NPDC050786 TaxID=3154840 RepID=UPI00340F5260